MASERWLESRKPAQAHERSLVSNQSIDQNSSESQDGGLFNTKPSLSFKNTPCPSEPSCCSQQHHENPRCLADGLSSYAGTPVLRGQSRHSTLSRSGRPLRGQGTLEWKQQSHLHVWKNREGRSCGHQLPSSPIAHNKCGCSRRSRTKYSEHKIQHSKLSHGYMMLECKSKQNLKLTAFHRFLKRILHFLW